MSDAVAVVPAWISTALRDVPAVVVYAPHERAAAVWHPAGPTHEAVVNAATRLRKKGFLVFLCLPIPVVAGDSR